MNGLRYEAGGIAGGAVGAKSVTEKTTREACFDMLSNHALGGCSKNTEKPAAIWSARAVCRARAMDF
jgi:hypothetical protein